MADGFKCADISSYEGENCDADSSLWDNAYNWKLEGSRSKSFTGTGEKEIPVESAGNVGEDYDERCDSSKTLELELDFV